MRQHHDGMAAYEGATPLSPSTVVKMVVVVMVNNDNAGVGCSAEYEKGESCKNYT